MSLETCKLLGFLSEEGLDSSFYYKYSSTKRFCVNTACFVLFERIQDVKTAIAIVFVNQAVFKSSNLSDSKLNVYTRQDGVRLFIANFSDIHDMRFNFKCPDYTEQIYVSKNTCCDVQIEKHTFMTVEVSHNFENIFDVFLPLTNDQMLQVLDSRYFFRPYKCAFKDRHLHKWKGEQFVTIPIEIMFEKKPMLCHIL